MKNSLLRGTTAVLGGSEIPFAVSLLKIDGADTRREHKLTAGTVKNIHPCIFFTYVFAGQTRCCVEPPPSVAVLKYHLPLAFENSGTGYKARTKIKRRHGKKYTSLYIFYLRVCRANTLLRGTTAIRGGSEIPFAVSLLKIDGADTRREHKLTAGVSLIR